MIELFQRWPALSSIPHLSLAELPTPVHELPRLTSKLDAGIWIKRDDLTAKPYGGNKVRKLEFVLGRARQKRADTLITAGAVGSHHVFATALYGREHGFVTHAVLLPQPYHAHVEDQLRADLAVGAQLVSAQRVSHVLREVVRLSAQLKLRGKRPYVIPMGGSNLYGVLGFVNAGLELGRQMDEGLCPDPDAVYVPCGTCATAAGLALGLAAAGVDTQVVAVRSTDRWLANTLQLKRLIYKAEGFLREREPRFPRVAARAFESVVLDHVEFGKGYGLSTPSSEAAAQLASREGITLDPTYTGKAFAALVRDAEAERHGQKLLFWNTLSSASLEPFLANAPDAPEEFVRLLTL